MFYFYAPLYDGPLGPPVTDPDTGIEYPPGNGKTPCVDNGSGPEWVEAPTGMTVLKRDEDLGRFVLKLAFRRLLAGWTEKTSAEVLVDYPDLPGVN